MVRTAATFLKALFRAALAALLLVQSAPRAGADVLDPLDPFDIRIPGLDEDENDDEKTPDQLILEATLLLDDERPLDARTKLLKALKKDPKQYRAHILLASYYLAHVGHFRLALKYVRQAQALFEEKHGPPPYDKLDVKREHANLLYLLAHVKLDLDNYQDALDVLDQYTSYDYYADWYAGTRAWVLMKLGNLDEAIKIARMGILAGAEPGRTLNMLGILLSMQGQRQAALQVFKDAVRYEMALGSDGQPATPLNNSGEVYKEIFADDNAASAWLRATGMPDGCDHVLPALNLAILYIDHMNFDGAKKAMDDFEACVARFPLKNGEEHRALVHLVRGRIDLHSGKIDSAIEHLRASLEKRQWFGKIGTSQADMESAARVSLAEALEMKNNHLSFRRTSSISEWADDVRAAAENLVTAWWHKRRSLQILTKDLSGLEDLYVRNTDSLLEYPTLGRTLSSLPRRTLERRIEIEKKEDDRPEARVFYDLYLAQNIAANGSPMEAIKLLDKVITESRPQHDKLLRQSAMITKLSLLDPRTEDYTKLAIAVFNTRRPDIRNYGFRLPVRFHGESRAARDTLRGSAFLPDNNRPSPFTIAHEQENGRHVLRFLSSSPSVDDFRVDAETIEEAVNELTDEVFTAALADNKPFGGMP